MTNFPKIVHDRLKVTPPAEHPDVNLLAAFAENSLLGREHVTVLDHLSRCATCREVMALALPAIEAIQPALSPKRTSWLTWPTLRWGFVAAGIVAIASFGVVRYAHESRMEAVSQKTAATEAKNEFVPSPPASSANADKSLPVYPVPNSPVAAPHARRQELTARAEAKGTLLTSTVTGGPLLTRQPQSMQQSGARVAGAPLFDRPQQSPSKDFRLPASNQMVEGTGENVQTVAQNQPPSAQALDLSEPAVAKSKPAEIPQAGYGSAAAAGAPAASPPAGLVATQLGETRPKDMQASTRWTISRTGALERSTDQGQTWQDVNVAASDAAISSFSYAPETVSAQELRKQSSNKQALKKSAAAPLVFRTVTSNGSDVWAGGSQGALYHSVDNGNHFTRVVPTASGTSLSGDVVALDFPDLQHGKVTTSAPEVWTTSDDGLTWQKQ